MPLLGHLKTALAGTCRAFDFAQYADRRAAGFPFRFNHRFDMKSRLHALLGALAVASPSCGRRCRLAETPR